MAMTRQPPIQSAEPTLPANGHKLPLGHAVSAFPLSKPTAGATAGATVVGQTFIVGDLSSATAAWRETDGTFDFVTLSANSSAGTEFIPAATSMATVRKAPSSVFDGKNQIAELQADLAGLQERVARGAGKKTVAERAGCVAGRLAAGQTELRAQEVAIATCEGDSTRCKVPAGCFTENRHGGLRAAEPRRPGAGRLAKAGRAIGAGGPTGEPTSVSGSSSWTD